MSPTPYPFFVISHKHSPEQIKSRTGMLIRLYLQDKNKFVAQAVQQHINAILAFPGFIVDPQQRCALRRLATHWSHLAWIESETK